MRALTIAYILLICTVAGFSQTTATYDNVRARQQLTLNGHTLTSVLQTIDSLSTHAQGVTAKAVYDYIATKYSTVSAGTGIDVVKAGSNYTISLDTLKRLHFRTDSTYTGGVGTMRWNLTDGTLDLGLLGGNVTLQLGQESVQRVKHADNSGLVQGSVVYLVGSDGTNPTVRYARANTDLTSANTFGVMTEDATGGSKAFCTTFGLVRNINTNNLTEGGLVWLSKDTAGAMTAVRPTAPNHGVEIGFCIRKHATQGVVFVTVQNGYELNELHDVYAPSPSNNQGLLWKSANLRWEAAAVDTSLTNEGRLIGFKPSNNSYYNIGSSTNGSSPIILYRGSGIGFSGTSGSPEGGDLTISNTGDLDSGNEGILGVGAGTATSSVITSNTSGATGVTINATGGISIQETTSSNGGSILLSATDQSVSNEGILGVAINPGADAWLRSNTSTANDIGLVGTNNTTITATASSNGGQIVIDSKAQIDTFSVSGSTLSLSLKNDGEPAKTVTLPGGGGGGGISGITQYIPKFNSSTTIDTSGLYWSTGGNLGIGTTSPTARLDIKGTAATDSTVRVGPELLTTGTGTGWSGTSFATGYTHSTGTTALTANSLTITAGTYYMVTVTVTGRTAGTCTATVGGLTTGAINTNTTVTVEGFATTTANFSVATSSTFNGTVTASLKIRQLSSPVIDLKNSLGVTTFEIRAQKDATNTSVGVNSMGNITTGYNNSYYGFGAGKNTTSGWGNFYAGYNAAQFATSANQNIVIGNSAATTLANATRCIVIGFGANVSNSSADNQIVIGHQSISLGVNTTYIGTSNTARTVLGGSLVMGSTTASANARTHTIGSGNVEGTYSLWATNSTNSASEPGLCVRDDLKVGIRTNSIDAGAALEVDGTTGGILFPRLTTTQRDALTPVNGLMIYNTTTSKFQGYAGGAWVDLH